MTGKEQARLLGIFFWVFTAFNIILIGAIAIIYIAIFGAVFSQMPHKAGEPGPEFILPFLIVIFSIAFVFTILFSIPKIIAGYGLRKEKPWARGWAIAAAIMACMSFPIGTAIGVFGLIFLFGDEGKRYFENPDYGRLDAVPNSITSAPPPNSCQ